MNTYEKLPGGLSGRAPAYSFIRSIAGLRELLQRAHYFGEAQSLECFTGTPWQRRMKGSYYLGKSQMRYTVILQREADGGYVATVPTLPGCVSQGDTREEALKNVEEAIGLYLEDVEAAGESIPVETERTFVEVKTGPR
jgi:predicted RNase H-like HicB family nuclease